MDETKLIEQHRKEKEESRRFKERRTLQWNETYLLYRDKVLTNRLTQRQPVNIPIIRDTLQSWISKVDEEPQVTFETRGRSNQDRDGELILNELWQYTYDREKLDLVDNLDKKVVGLMGRSFKHWYVHQNRLKCTVVDPYDIDIDPRVNPLDINTASYFNHKHIFVPLRLILANRSYSMEGKRALKHFLDSKQGIIEASKSDQEAAMRRQRLESLGAHNYDEYRVGEVMVELNRSYRMVWNAKENRMVRHLVVIALDSVVLCNKPVKEALGIDQLPFTTWASDPDPNDFWSDGIADNVRTVNKVINMYFSQDLENRAYRNFAMYFYNTQNGTFQPRAFEAKPFGMYGVPGNPDEIMKQMKIEPLADTTQAIEYFKNLIQSSVAQTPTERGVAEKGDVTLGEVQLSLQQSQTRQQVVAKQYRKSWEESGTLFYELLNSNGRGRFTLYKKGADGSMYDKTVEKRDWYTPKGYECVVVLKSEREANDDLELKKTSYVKRSFADNPAAQKIAKRKELELLGWSDDEIKEVLQFEEQKAAPQAVPVAPGVPAAAAPAEAAGEPVPSELAAELVPA